MLFFRFLPARRNVWKYKILIKTGVLKECRSTAIQTVTPPFFVLYCCYCLHNFLFHKYTAWNPVLPISSLNSLDIMQPPFLVFPLFLLNSPISLLFFIPDIFILYFIFNCIMASKLANILLSALAKYKLSSSTCCLSLVSGVLLIYALLSVTPKILCGRSTIAKPRYCVLLPIPFCCHPFPDACNK